MNLGLALLFYPLVLFLNLIFFNSTAFGQSKSLVDEARETLQRLDVYNSMIEVGVDSSEIRYGESVESRAFFELAFTNSSLVLDTSLMHDWFYLEAAEKKDYLVLAKMFAALTIFYYPTEVEAAQVMRNNNFLGFLKDIFPSKTKADIRQWILNQYKVFEEGLLVALRSKNPKERQKALDYLYQNRLDHKFFSQFTNRLISKLSLSGKLRFIEDILDGPSNALKAFVVPWALTAVPFRVWDQQERLLYSKLFEGLSHDNLYARMVLIAVTGSKDLLQARIPLHPILQSDLTTYRYQGQGHTLPEQLILHYPHFREAFLEYSTRKEIQPWMLNLIDFYFMNDIPQVKELGQTLAQPQAMSDPRWPRWFNLLSDPVRAPTVGRLVHLQGLYESTTDLAFEIQKKVYRDAKARVETGDPIPMSHFVRHASKNTRLVKFFIAQAGAEVLSFGKTSITRSFVESVFFHPLADKGSQMIWLELILMKNTRDLVSLEALIKGLGTSNDFAIEIEFARNNEKMTIEVIKGALQEYLFQDSLGAAPVSCSKAFLE